MSDLDKDDHIQLPGFDHDDHIQQAISLIVLVIVGLIYFVIDPVSSLSRFLLGTLGIIAIFWFFLIAKALWMPLAWIRGFRDLYRMLLRR